MHKLQMSQIFLQMNLVHLTIRTLKTAQRHFCIYFFKVKLENTISSLILAITAIMKLEYWNIHIVYIYIYIYIYMYMYIYI